MPEKFVIIGDGIAGATAAETLRAKDPEAEITIITNEGEPLYNRVAIKDFAKGTRPEEKVRIHDLKWYEDRSITLKLFTQVAMVDDASNVVVCEDGTRFDYTKLLIATGGTPRKYPAPNSTADGIHTFWTFADARRIRAHAEAAESGVIVGAGLLGIDLAVIFGKHGVKSKYLMRGNRWWREGLSKEGSEIVERTLKELGVDCIFHETVTEFTTDDKGHVIGCVTDKGTKYDAQIAGVAIGLNMSLRHVSSSHIKTGEGILADEFLRTSVDNVWVAGDCAQYFDPLLNRIHIAGSWASAKKQGQTAAMNMIAASRGEKPTPYWHVDFYSIDHFDYPVMSVGNILGDEVLEEKYNENVYRRIIFKEGRLQGCVFVGDAKPLPFAKKVIDLQYDCSALKAEMIKESFDWKGLMVEAVKASKE